MKQLLPAASLFQSLSHCSFCLSIFFAFELAGVDLATGASWYYGPEEVEAPKPSQAKSIRQVTQHRHRFRTLSD